MNEIKELTIDASLSIEAASRELDEILRRLRSEDITLEESFSLYQQGMELVKILNDKIDGYEKQLEVWESP